ncbi:MAG: DUF2970 domain-containing protein [Arenicellales bacterium]
MDDKKQPASQQTHSNVSTFSIIKSAMAAMVGIQNDANRERDFNSGKFWHFFIAGFFVTVAFIGAVWLMAQYFLNSA